jgi:Flp pilus assembly protein TadD
MARAMLKRWRERKVSAMKVQFRSILFALVLPAAACGGDRETPSTSRAPQDHLPEPMASVDTPPPPLEGPSKISEQPRPVEVKAPLPTTYDELITAGKALVAKQKYGDAKEMFEAAIKLQRKNAEPHIELARMYIAMDERALAMTHARKAVKLAPLSSLAFNTLGRAELNRKDYEGAILAFTQAIELNRENAFAWNNLGYTELLLERFEDAAEHLTEATELKDATGYMFNNLGTALEHLDRLDEARLAYEAGGKLGSSSATASRKRLEGVDSIAIVKASKEPSASLSPAPEAGVHEYELVDETSILEEEMAAAQAAEEAKAAAEAEESLEMQEELAPTAEEAGAFEVTVDGGGSAAEGSGASEELESEPAE